MFDIDILNHFAFRESWQKYTTASESADLQGLRGASRVLSELFLKDLPRNNPGSDKTAMLQNSTLSTQAGRLRSRFFGELMLSSIMEENTAVLENVTGQVTIVEQRIVVVPEIAITLAVLFGLAAFYIAAMLWYASNSCRPLGLGTDPATTVGTASLLGMNSSLAVSLRALRSGQALDIWSPIRSRSYALRDRILSEHPQTDQSYIGTFTVRMEISY